jgi:hypothetical protein
MPCHTNKKILLGETTLTNLVFFVFFLIVHDAQNKVILTYKENQDEILMELVIILTNNGEFL